MSLALKGVSGPLKDRQFTLKPGLTLGRQGDVQIGDLKVSSVHARINRSADGTWVLVDNNSKNGVRVNGERVDSVALRPGVVFYVGEQGFEVVGSELPPEPPPVDEHTLPPPPKAKRYWHEILSEFVEQSLGAIKDRNFTPVAALNPALVLDFVKGSQANSRWVLGYGPRKIGSASMDLPIYEPGAPADSFEIVPSPDGIVFKTTHPELVLLNGRSVDTQVLRVGDTIKILDTLIEVDFTE